MAMDDLLKALLAGAASGEEPPQQPAQGGGLDVGSLLGALLGGGAAPAGGAQQPQQPAQSSGLDVGSLLGALLGGGAAPAGEPQLAPTPPARQPQQASDALGSLLTTLMGSARADSPLASVIQTLAQKLGLPPAIAQAVVAFAFSKILPALIGGAKPQAQPHPQAAKPAPQAQAGGLDLGDLLGRIAGVGGKRLSANYLQSTGLHAELAQQTGLDEDTALESLQVAFQGLGGALVNLLPAIQAQPAKGEAPGGPKPAAKPKPAPAKPAAAKKPAKSEPKPAAKPAAKTPAKRRQPPEE